MKRNSGKPARVAPAWRLHPRPKTRLARWLTEPGVPVSAAEREALIQDIDASAGPVISSAISLALMTVTGLYLSPGWYFYAVMAAVVVACAARITVCMLLDRGWWKDRPAVTDWYIGVSLAWSVVFGLSMGGAEASNVTSLQTLAAMTSLAFQGILCARNFSAPRFALAILLAIDIPFIVGVMLAKDHWLLMTLVFTPNWVLGCLVTVRRTQKFALESYAARFASQEKARRDPLTDALNRLGLTQVYEDPALPESLTLFCLDLDGFKKVNDTMGHPAGDLLLRLVTERLRRCIREGDALARCGGDEFVIVAPLMGPGDAEVYAARLIEKVARDPYALDGGAVARIGVSVGFGCRPFDGGTMDELHARADEALYVAKREGKGVWRRAKVGSGDQAAVAGSL